MFSVLQNCLLFSSAQRAARTVSYSVMVAGRKEGKKVVLIPEFRTNDTSFIHEKT